MTSTKQDAPMYNITGALIFSAYVLSALLLTLFIARSLLNLYQKLSRSEDRKPAQDLEKLLQVFSALSVLSFSTLSYHMLSYLIFSYKSWAKSNSVRLPQILLGQGGLLGSRDQRVELHVWQWLTSSTLFKDFAETICGTSARFWWTQQALLVTMGWSVFMSFEGQSGGLRPSL